MAVGLTVFALMTAPPTLTTLPAFGKTSKQDAVLVVSSSPERTTAKPLKGPQFGTIYVFIRKSDGIKRVRYFLDDPDMSDRPLRNSREAPFDLGGHAPNGTALGFDTTELAHGAHTLTAAIETVGGEMTTVTAKFKSEHLFLSPDGSNGSCTKSHPCVLISTAYRRARSGQVVELSSGSYPGDLIEFDPRKSSADHVVFRPSEDATVTVDGEIRLIGAKHLTFARMTLGNFFVAPTSTSPDPGQRPEDIKLVNVTQRFFFIRSAVDVRIIGGSVGGQDDAISPTIGSYAGQPPSQKVLVDGVSFHDISRRNNPENHVECLFIQESNGVTVRRSRFTRCDIMDVFVNAIVDGQISNLTLENNFFDQPAGGGFQAVAVYALAGGLIRNNSFGGSLLLNPGTYTNFEVIGNAGELSECTPGVLFAYNVWANARCAKTDRRANPGFRDPLNFDLHLRPSAAAINRADPDNYPPTDIDGDPRPNGKRPDAGADELR